MDQIDKKIQKFHELAEELRKEIKILHSKSKDKRERNELLEKFVECITLVCCVDECDDNNDKVVIDVDVYGILEKISEIITLDIPDSDPILFNPSGINLPKN